tara:strand:+ start:157 stop:303 length:147 start_codon:yes stop_codon:yes gene_type:complete
MDIGRMRKFLLALLLTAIAFKFILGVVNFSKAFCFYNFKLIKWQNSIA